MHHAFITSTCLTIYRSRSASPVASSDVLKARGYNVKRSGEFDEHNPGVWGDSELIAVDPQTGDLLGGHDTRKTYGSAAGY